MVQLTRETAQKLKQLLQHPQINGTNNLGQYGAMTGHGTQLIEITGGSGLPDPNGVMNLYTAIPLEYDATGNQFFYMPDRPKVYVFEANSFELLLGHIYAATRYGDATDSTPVFVVSIYWPKLVVDAALSINGCALTFTVSYTDGSEISTILNLPCCCQGCSGGSAGTCGCAGIDATTNPTFTATCTAAPDGSFFTVGNTYSLPWNVGANQWIFEGDDGFSMLSIQCSPQTQPAALDCTDYEVICWDAGSPPWDTGPMSAVAWPTSCDCTPSWTYDFTINGQAYEFTIA